MSLEDHLRSSFLVLSYNSSSLLGPVVQSIVSLTSSLVAKMLTVLVSTVPNANAKATHICSPTILAYMPYLMIKVLTIR